MKINKSNFNKTLLTSLKPGKVFKADILDIKKDTITLMSLNGTKVKAKYNNVDLKIGDRVNFMIKSNDNKGNIEIKVADQINNKDQLTKTLVNEKVKFNGNLLNKMKLFLKDENIKLEDLIYLLKNKVKLTKGNIDKFKEILNDSIINQIKEKKLPFLDLKDLQDVEKYFDDILKNLKPEDKLFKEIKFLSELNNFNSFVQIPFKFDGDKRKADLIMLNGKKNVKTAVLKIELKNFGNTEVYIKKMNKNIELDFKSEKNQYIFKNKIHELKEELIKKGYNINRVDFANTDQFFNMLRLEKDNDVGRYSFDMRV